MSITIQRFMPSAGEIPQTSLPSDSPRSPITIVDFVVDTDQDFYNNIAHLIVLLTETHGKYYTALQMVKELPRKLQRDTIARVLEYHAQKGHLNVALGIRNPLSKHHLERILKANVVAGFLCAAQQTADLLKRKLTRKELDNLRHVSVEQLMDRGLDQQATARKIDAIDRLIAQYIIQGAPFHTKSK